MTWESDGRLNLADQFLNMVLCQKSDVERFVGLLGIIFATCFDWHGANLHRVDSLHVAVGSVRFVVEK